MTITFVGTGSIIPSPRGKNPQQSYSAILVEVSDQKLLFDIGPGTLTKLQNSGIDTRIYPDQLFITHYHIDHCLDFVGLVKGRVFDPATGKIGPGKHLPVWGPTDLSSWTEDLYTRVGRWDYMSKHLNSDKILTLTEVSDGPVTQGDGWRVTCTPVEHYDGVAFRVDTPEGSFAYSGDMGYDERFATLAHEADIVAIECSWPDAQSRGGLHLCPDDVGKLAHMGKFKHTILTHLYPQCEGKEDEMIETVRQYTQGQVTIAHDGMKIRL